MTVNRITTPQAGELRHACAGGYGFGCHISLIPYGIDQHPLRQIGGGWPTCLMSKGAPR
jgi:hypothetical protein